MARRDVIAARARSASCSAARDCLPPGEIGDALVGLVHGVHEDQEQGV